MTSQNLTITAVDGGTFKAHIVMPEKTPAPAVILIQEIFGVNAEMREKCDWLADQGYIAICPDLFWRIEPGIDLVDSDPEQLKRAFELFGLFDPQKGVADLKATLKAARNLKGSNGQVGCIGYCLGGKLAYMMATQTDVDAAVSYYGVGIGAMLSDAAKIKKPLLMHIAGHDQFVPAEEQAAIKAAMENVESADVHIYPGLDHAFARGNGMHYNEQAARLANDRTEAFLKQTLRKAKAA